THNEIIVAMNQTFISFSEKIFKRLSDGCADLHVPEIREFLNTAKRKTNYHIAFFISNVNLTDYAINELENYTDDKDKICICLIQDFIPKVYKYENIFKINKIELEKEKNKSLEYEIENKILKTHNEKLETKIKTIEEKLDLILEILNKK
ncbi:23664_t:CDS:2, partial [Cetraspora pellucida]